jgi:squalene-associated FAD-dependent desaturase
MKVAVIGGGWAGLSAAVELDRAGCRPVVFEAAPALGGRARTIWSRRLGAPIDNGQHLLLGACSAVLDLVRSLNPDADTAFLRIPLALASANGSFRLKAARLPAPWHLLAGLAGARGMALSDRLRLARLCRRLGAADGAPRPGRTVTEWLQDDGQSAGLRHRLWEPLCLAAMNTPADQACARTFARLLGDSLAGPAAASDLLIPRSGLSELWVAHLPASVDVRLATPARQLRIDGDRIMIEDEAFDDAILACPPFAAARLLRTLPAGPEARAYLGALDAFTYLPIATLTLELAGAWSLPHPMLMLAPAPPRGAFGQWLFCHGAAPSTPGRTRATVVISDARQLMSRPRDEVVETLVRQVRAETSRMAPMPDIAGYDLITEKRATFAATPTLRRPPNRTPWPHVWTAGDWTDTGYPSVLEGAVRSGRTAALDILRRA